MWEEEHHLAFVESMVALPMSNIPCFYGNGSKFLLTSADHCSDVSPLRFIYLVNSNKCIEVTTLLNR